MINPNNKIKENITQGLTIIYYDWQPGFSVFDEDDKEYLYTYSLGAYNSSKPGEE